MKRLFPLCKPVQPGKIATALFFATFFFFSCNEGNMKKRGEGSVPNPAGTVSTTGSSASPAGGDKQRIDSVPDGDYVARYPNGVIRMKGFYKNGKREGDWVAFFETGKVQSEGYFTAGMRDHHAVVYYETGKKMYEGEYKNGVQIGKWKYYKEDGSLKHEEDYGKGPPEEGK
jgi:antitoxin component YwqK of YwqJK toxin-antitoxin module